MSAQKFYISGLHCAACEVLIEKKLKKVTGVSLADVNLPKNTLALKSARPLSQKYLNTLFAADGYSFSKTPFSQKYSFAPDCPVESRPNVPKSIFLALLFLAAFVLLNRSGFSSLVSVNSQSSLPLFFFFGLLAGISSCAALVGGIILSLSRQWASLYSSSDSTLEKLQPHLLFNAGRIASYALFGAILGSLGTFFRFSTVFTSSLVLAVSVLMIVLGLQMLGVKYFRQFQFRLPKNLTRGAADETRFQGRYAPLLMGAFTFFLPCGFTITAQALALASGNALTGALIMALFALGTLPGLLLIGLTSVRLYSNPRLSAQFSTAAGVIVLFFALFNINSQLAVLGAPNLNDVLLKNSETLISTDGYVPLENGVQVVKMDASATGYQPNQFKLRPGIPVRWEITDRGTSGCTNAVMARGLFPGQIDLVPGTTSVKEFTAPDKPGTYRFSCWMGMITGSFIVADQGSVGSVAPVVDSGAKGCGCGGGGGMTCGGLR